jgi:hypothetical protein
MTYLAIFQILFNIKNGNFFRLYLVKIICCIVLHSMLIASLVRYMVVHLITMSKLERCIHNF